MSYFGEPVLRNTFLSGPYNCLHLITDDTATVWLNLLRTVLRTHEPSNCFGNSDIALAKQHHPGCLSRLEVEQGLAACF